MIGVNHAMAGIIIAAAAPAPFVPALALASHFLMDALPHFGNSATFKPWTKAFKWLLVFDAIMCIAVLSFSIWLFPDKWWLMATGAFFATLPDFLWLLEGKISWLRGYFNFAKKIQWAEIPEGWMYELFYFALLFVTITYLT